MNYLPDYGSGIDGLTTTTVWVPAPGQNHTRIIRDYIVGDAHAERAAREGVSRQVAKWRNFMEHWGSRGSGKSRIDLRPVSKEEATAILDKFKESYTLLVWDEWVEDTTMQETCECGSGSNLVGPGHSDWCRRFKA